MQHGGGGSGLTAERPSAGQGGASTVQGDDRAFSRGAALLGDGLSGATQDGLRHRELFFLHGEDQAEAVPSWRQGGRPMEGIGRRRDGRGAAPPPERAQHHGATGHPISGSRRRGREARRRRGAGSGQAWQRRGGMRGVDGCVGSGRWGSRGDALVAARSSLLTIPSIFLGVEIEINLQ